MLEYGSLLFNALLHLYHLRLHEPVGPGEGEEGGGAAMMNIIVDVCDILSVSISCFVCLKCRILTFKAHLKLNKHKKLKKKEEKKNGTFESM